MSFKEIKFENETIYIDMPKAEGLNSVKKLNLSEKQLQDSILPIANFVKTIQNEMGKIVPNETELTVQLSAHIDQGKLLFGLVNAGAEAMFSLKFIWKNE